MTSGDTPFGISKLGLLHLFLGKVFPHDGLVLYRWDSPAEIVGIRVQPRARPPLALWCREEGRGLLNADATRDLEGSAMKSTLAIPLGCGAVVAFYHADAEPWSAEHLELGEAIAPALAGTLEIGNPALLNLVTHLDRSQPIEPSLDLR